MPVFGNLLLALAALALPGLAAATAVAQPAVVDVDQVRIEPLAQTQPVIGRFVARQSGVIAARVAGAVTEMHVAIGDRVARGQVVAVIDLQRLAWQRDLAQAKVDELAAMLDAARARLDKRQNELTRLQGLRDSAAFSRARHDDAVTDVFEAQAEVAAANAALARGRTALKLAEADLGHAQVRAPYGGVVRLRDTEIGAYVKIGDPVIELVNDTDLEIEVDVPHDRVGALSPGAAVDIRLDDGSLQKAVVRAIGAEENPMSRTRRVRFTPRLDGAAGSHGVGESLDALLPLGAPRDVVTVPKDAILKRQGLSLVYVVDENGNAQVRPVELGEAVGSRFVVHNGLKPGETVVVRGNERLRPGQAVRIGGES